MNKWDKRFLEMALLTSTWSKDPSTKVGAVIVTPNKRIVSLGFNGFAQGVLDTEMSREQRLRRTLHAEENALFFSSQPLTGFHIYITHPPCARCAAKLIQCGITDITAIRGDTGFMERWAEDYCDAKDMFAEAGVVYTEAELR